ncbi:glycosyltransferase [Ramlibacter sp. PS4R-6]|uniref:glycosyltransferase n=1 Tax=Ramlibacter sp. PS4R-6 TaxID=3133438 RepID=UPI0030A9A3CB
MSPFTVVICTRDRPAELERCLASVVELDYPDFHILVVDSCPRHYPAEGLARRFGASYLHEPVPGVSRARNRGVRASATELVALIDDEAVARPDWLRMLAPEFDDLDVAVVAGRIKDFEASTPEEKLCVALGSNDCGPHRRVVDSTSPQWFERACFGGIGNGANLAVRRSVFEDWPGFCECLGAGTRIPGAEEHYAFFELIERGWRAIYSPAAIVSHPFPAMFGTLKARHIRSVSASTAYLAFLWMQQPRFRGAIARYLWEACCGVRRSWRGQGEEVSVRIVPAWRRAIAFAAGLGHFALFLAAGPVPPEPPPRRSALVAQPARAASGERDR